MERIPVVDASLREEESLQEEISLPVAIAAGEITGLTPPELFKEVFPNVCSRKETIC